MIITILIILFSLIALTALHELGHFLLARKFGVGVEEFGIGYPPRIFGRKFGKTIYSLNLLPFGAFVKILGDEQASDSPESFSKKPIWQRALILVGGVVSFWIVAFVIFSFLSGVGGLPKPVEEDFHQSGVEPYVQIFQVSSGSPAQTAGLKAGDIIKQLSIANDQLPIEISKVEDVRSFADEYKGAMIEINVLRGDEEQTFSLTPRVDFPANDGPMGIGLLRVAKIEVPWYKAPVVGFQITVQQTKGIPVALYSAIKSKLSGGPDMGLQFVGPIGVGQVMGQALDSGVGNFLMLVAMISIWMALFNLAPIPALDGGRLLFLFVEFLRGKPMNQKIEQKIIAACFFALIGLMIIVSVKDIIGLF